MLSSTCHMHVRSHELFSVSMHFFELASHTTCVFTSILTWREDMEDSGREDERDDEVDCRGSISLLGKMEIAFDGSGVPERLLLTTTTRANLNTAGAADAAAAECFVGWCGPAAP